MRSRKWTLATEPPLYWWKPVQVALPDLETPAKIVLDPDIPLPTTSTSTCVKPTRI